MLARRQRLATARANGYEVPVPKRIAVASVVAVDEHDPGPHHPERRERLRAAMAGVADARLGDDVVFLEPAAWGPAPAADLVRVHDPRLLDSLRAVSDAGGGELDPDTNVSRGSYATACLAAGSGLAAVESVQRGDADNAFVATRPPGHHATRDRAQGFCLVNHVAVAAARLADAGERVLVVDWDVHHGNGTQAIFWDDPRVLYASIHQWPAYPGTGSPAETGGAAAAGLVVNVPLPPGATGDAALAALDDVIGPAASAFAPTWVLVSAGFDAHRDDPLADLQWSAGDYAALTARVLELAPGGRQVVLFLEGGYDLDALRRSVTASVSTLAGRPATGEAPSTGGPGREQVARAAAVRARALDA
jgi:acetoin utilization deacetylase AcuC-like enzyme